MIKGKEPQTVNNIQEHLVKLLGEIDEICISNRIPYVLYGRTARDACSKGHFIGSYVFASVMIPAEHIERFESLVEKKYKGARSLEWLANNPAFPGLHMRYVDMNTTFIYGDSVQKYNCSGIYVTIERVRQIPSGKIKAKLANGIDKVLEFTTVSDLSSLSRTKRAAVRVFNGLARLFGREKTVRRLLRWQMRLCKKHGSKMAVIRYLKNNIDFSGAHLTKVKRVAFENRSFLVPNDHKPYLNLVYGKTWVENASSSISSPHLLASSTEVSFRDVLANEDKKSLAEVNAVISERNRIMSEMKPLEAKIQGFWEHLFLTQTRFDFFRKYYPHRKELAAHLEKKDYRILTDLTSDLMSTETKYLDKGLVMPVCKEADQIVYSLYIYKGDYAHADLFKNRLARFPGSALQLDSSIPEQDEDFWPRYLQTDDAGLLPVFAVGPDGKEFRIAYKNYNNRIYNLLKTGSEQPAAASPAESVLVAFDGDEELPFDEVYGLCADGMSYLPLYQRDDEGKEMELCAVTADGAVFPTAKINGMRYIGSRPLPYQCVLNGDHSLDCSLFFGEEELGRLFWLCDSGEEMPALEAVSGKISVNSPIVLNKLFENKNSFDLTGRFQTLRDLEAGIAPAKLLCEAADGTRTELRTLLDELSEKSPAGDEADFDELPPVSPFSLHGSDRFGRDLLFAYITETLDLVPAGTMSSGGVFTPAAAK